MTKYNHPLSLKIAKALIDRFDPAPHNEVKQYKVAGGAGHDYRVTRFHNALTVSSPHCGETDPGHIAWVDALKVSIDCEVCAKAFLAMLTIMPPEEVIEVTSDPRVTPAMVDEWISAGLAFPELDEVTAFSTMQIVKSNDATLNLLLCSFVSKRMIENAKLEQAMAPEVQNG